MHGCIYKGVACSTPSRPPLSTLLLYNPIIEDNTTEFNAKLYSIKANLRQPNLFLAVYLNVKYIQNTHKNFNIND